MKAIPTTALTAALLAGLPASATITYIDAVEGPGGNTFATGGSQADTSWLSTDDGDWENRAFGNNATIFETRVDAADNVELTTQITGLADGTYDIYVFFWDQVTNDTGSNWTISAGFTPGSLTSYSAAGEPLVPDTTQQGVTYAGALSFTNTVQTDDTVNRQLFGANIGQVVVSGGSAVNVYIDNYTDIVAAGDGNVGDQRTWYDGVGYELAAVPGDTDGDGDVDDSDLGTSFANYTGPVGDVGKTAAQGDTDNDGDVDDSDLGTSFSAYTGPLGPASVPEPTSLALLGLGGLAMIRRRRAAH